MITLAFARSASRDHNQFEKQKIEIQQFAQSKGWEVTETVDLADTIIGDLYAIVVNKGAGRIIFTDLYQLSRDFDEALAILRSVESIKVEVWSSSSKKRLESQEIRHEISRVKTQFTESNVIEDGYQYTGKVMPGGGIIIPISLLNEMGVEDGDEIVVILKPIRK
jgi:hypothetical protein